VVILGVYMKLKNITDEQIKGYFPLIGRIIKKRRVGWDLCETVWDDIFANASSGLVRAFKNYDPNHESKANFMTLVHKYISTEINSTLGSIARYNERVKKISLSDLHNEKTGYSLLTQEISSPYKQVERKDINHILARALNTLNSEDAQIITEYYLNGNNSDGRIKKELGLSISHQAIRLRRLKALKKLRFALWQDCIESDLL